MNSLSPSHLGPREVLQLLAVYWRRWLVPATVLAGVAAVYACTAPPTWQASQALIIRNEAANNDVGPGKFGHADEMKNVQETILELAKSRGVLAAALRAVGPSADTQDKTAWPGDRDIDALRQTVKIVPPKGVEFGTSEMFYLDIRDRDRVRAVRLNSAICEQLQARFQEIRDAKAQSMIDELDKTVRLANSDLDEATGRLAAVEKQVGSDLAELRTLQDSGSGGDSALRRTLTEIENELRQARAAEEANRQLLGLLRAAQDDPGRLLATPGRLLDSEPALKRLKEGLVDAQLRSAHLQGSMSAEHPVVRAAKEAEEQVGRHLHDELAIATRGLEAELRLNAERAVRLDSQLAQAKQRLSTLAALRATYSNQVAETTHRAKLVERAEQNLAEARATRASAKAASLISAVDSPETGIRPVSPSRTLVILGGILGGLAVGFGTVLLTAETNPPVAASRTIAPAALRARHLQPTFKTPAAARNGRFALRQALECVLNG